MKKNPMQIDDCTEHEDRMRRSSLEEEMIKRTIDTKNEAFGHAKGLNEINWLCTNEERRHRPMNGSAPCDEEEDRDNSIEDCTETTKTACA